MGLYGNLSFFFFIEAIFKIVGHFSSINKLIKYSECAELQEETITEIRSIRTPFSYDLSTYFSTASTDPGIASPPSSLVL